MTFVSFSAAKVATCRTGPKISRCISLMPFTRITRRGDEMAAFRGGHVAQQAAFLAGLVDMGADARLGLGVDDRADIGGEMPGVADGQFLHRAEEHVGEMGRDILLHVKAAERRAALAGGLERRRDDVAHGLFG